MRIYFELFTVFFKIGAFTLGGGYAMVPLIQKEVVGVRRWIEEKEFLDMLALAQISPGPLAINTSVFVGYKIKKMRGVLATVLGCALPSFLIILLIAMLFRNMGEHPVVVAAFKGIRPMVVSLIAVSVIRMGRIAGIRRVRILIPILIAVLIVVVRISPIVILLTAAAIGIFLGRRK